MFTVWMALQALQAAAAPVELPDGAPPEAWANPLALAGLHPGPVPADGPGARLGAADGRWWLWVRAEDGTEHVLQVDIPTTLAEREALTSLVASLIRPVRLPEVPLPAAPPAPPPRPAPRPAEPRWVEPSPSGPGAASAAIAPGPPRASGRPPVLRPLPASPNPPAAPPTLWGGWAGVAPGVRARGTVRPAAAVGAWVGVAGAFGPLPLRAGLGVEGAALAELPQLDADSRLVVADLRAVAAWAPGAWELGPVGSASVRALTDPAGLVVRGPVPTVGAWLARRVPLDGVVWLRPSLLVEIDLARTVVQDVDGRPFRMSPVAVGIAVGLGAGR